MEYFAKVVEYFLKVMGYFLRDGPYCQNVAGERTGMRIIFREEIGAEFVRNPAPIVGFVTR